MVVTSRRIIINKDKLGSTHSMHFEIMLSLPITNGPKHLRQCGIGGCPFAI